MYAVSLKCKHLIGFMSDRQTESTESQLLYGI